MFIPQPHSFLPWGIGSIIGWTFYINSETPSNIALQVWSKQSEDKYLLKGQTVYTGLLTGVHTYNLTSDEQIEFKAGDVLGMAFEDHNPIPFDSSLASCQRQGGVMYMPGGAQKVYSIGDTFYFRKKPDSWLACRMYSLYASYIGQG